MAAFLPFQVITASVSGLAINVSVCTTNVLDTTNKFAPTLLVANANLSNMIWVRMTSSTDGTTGSGSATANDIPVGPNSVRLFTNPNPLGKTAVAVFCSITTSNGAWICPGEGGA